MSHKVLFKHESIAFEEIGFLSDYYGGKQLLKILLVKKSSKGDHILYVHTLEQLQELIWLLEEAKYDLERSFKEKKEFFSWVKLSSLRLGFDLPALCAGIMVFLVL